MTRTSISYLY